MGYLSLIFNKYSKKRDIKIIDEFRDRLWSSLPYQKMNRYYSYRLCEDKIESNEILKELEKYKYVEYKVLRSRYDLNEVMVEDLVKARVNSNYGKYFDNEVYLGKQYYYQLANYKNIYFRYINGECNNVIDEIGNNTKLVEQYKQESIEKKIKLSWKDYKDFINGCIPKIFDNYIPMDNLVEQGKWKPNDKLEWDEDNYIVKYINKSIDGYILTYINELKEKYNYIKEKQCYNCNKLFRPKSNKAKHCDKCAKEIRRQKRIKYNANYYIKNK